MEELSPDTCEGECSIHETPDHQPAHAASPLEKPTRTAFLSVGFGGVGPRAAVHPSAPPSVALSVADSSGQCAPLTRMVRPFLG